MKILLVLQPSRKDWYTYLREDKENEYYLLWHESAKNVPAWILQDKFFRKVYCWNNFPTTKKLLHGINPDRIVFFEIIDQRQIALLVAANKKKIKTFYLEHGASAERETAIREAEHKNYFFSAKLKYLKNRFDSEFVNLLKSKYFYYSSASRLNSTSSFFKYIFLPFRMLFSTPNKVLAYCKFIERTPAESIVFNRSNFEVFELYTGIKSETAIFTGVPLFDKVYNSVKSKGSYAIFIDHPYLEDSLMEWTPAFHKKVADSLNNFVLTQKTKLFVRLHPRSSKVLWESYGYISDNFILSQHDDFTQELLNSKLILSFSSTLLTGMLCAKKNIVLLGWHPAPCISGFDFSKFGICHLSYDVNDLMAKYTYWLNNNLAETHFEEYMEFIYEINFPFDGNAAKRVIKALTS